MYSHCDQVALRSFLDDDDMDNTALMNLKLKIKDSNQKFVSISRLMN